jgi:hypothetical protein
MISPELKGFIEILEAERIWNINWAKVCAIIFF